jgi:hypothetical protein
MPWWGWVLICLGCAALGGLIVYVALMVFFGRGIRRVM